MSTCILHIGMRKTGTSSIQKSLAGYETDDYVYANIDGHTNHGAALYGIFSSSPEARFFYRGKLTQRNQCKEYIEVARRGLESCIQNADGRNVIFSGEGLSYLLSENDLQIMRNYFESKFNNVRIFCSVRSPAGYMISNFIQRVKDRAHAIDLQHDYFHYRKNLLPYDNVFGRENVHLWKFDPKSFPGGCAVQDFCSQIGISIPDEKIVRVNEALSREAVALLYIYNKYGGALGSLKMTTPQRSRLVSMLRGFGNGKFRFSPNILNPVLRRHQGDIEWMEQRLGNSLHEELGGVKEGDIATDEDMFKAASSVVDELIQLLGDSAPHAVAGNSPDEIAQLVHAIRHSKTKSPTTKSATFNTARIMRALPRVVTGWAIGSDYHTPVSVDLVVNGKSVATTMADIDRRRLQEKGIHPTGRCGFNFRFTNATSLTPGDVVEVRQSGESEFSGNITAVVGDADTA